MRDRGMLSRRLERVRGVRAGSAAAGTLADAFLEMGEAVARRARALSGVERAWSVVVPAAVGGRAVLRSFDRGVVMAEVGDAPSRFVLDRWLKAGGEAALRAADTRVKKVKVVLRGRGGGDGGAGKGGAG
ncbi:MAG: hypothetical protein HRU70_06700 [Phycisphaeraceae bacterium]|nr:MAG: hypothetical protein HRU70_06700 [Phycisphaeraceae bacterium]